MVDKNTPKVQQIPDRPKVDCQAELRFTKWEVLAQKERMRQMRRDFNAKISELLNLAMIDPLTDLLNRRGFEKTAQALLDIRKSCETGGYYILMLDMDHFKHVNDTYGHGGGDIVLKRLAAIFKEIVRKGDLVCRYGGEEFVLLIQSPEKDGAKKTAERIRGTVEKTQFKTSDGVVMRGKEGGPLTVSVGCAKVDGTDLNKMQGKADGALYKAKNSGRNQVQSAEASSGPFPETPKQENVQ